MVKITLTLWNDSEHIRTCDVASVGVQVKQLLAEHNFKDELDLELLIPKGLSFGSSRGVGYYGQPDYSALEVSFI